MPQALVEQINGELEYGDSRSAWIRDAIRMKLHRTGVGLEAPPGEDDSPSAGGQSTPRRVSED
jgi:hypothetical protein